MKLRTPIAGLLAFAVVAAPALVVAGEGHEHPRVAATSQLSMLKSLVGTWVEVNEAGEATEKIVSVYALTAGGSAIVETLFPGTEQEMVSVYHEDGDDVVMTHYCMLGNQPRMRAAKGDREGQIVFNCAGGTNMKSEDDKHMHHAEIHMIGEDRIKAEWQSYENGERKEGVTFDLARRKS